MHGATTKYVLKRAMERYLPRVGAVPLEDRLRRAAAPVDRGGPAPTRSRCCSDANASRTRPLRRRRRRARARREHARPRRPRVPDLRAALARALAADLPGPPRRGGDALSSAPAEPIRSALATQTRGRALLVRPRRHALRGPPPTHPALPRRRRELGTRRRAAARSAAARGRGVATRLSPAAPRGARAGRTRSTATLVAANRRGVFAGRPATRCSRRARVASGDLAAAPAALPRRRPGRGRSSASTARLAAARCGSSRRATAAGASRPSTLRAGRGPARPQRRVRRHARSLLGAHRRLRRAARHRPALVGLAALRVVRARRAALSRGRRLRSRRPPGLRHRHPARANALVPLDKAHRATERLRHFEGSCIYACRFGAWFAITTTVEPSRVNPSRDATLWVSRDLERWHCVLRARKDRWHADYFQFGSLVLPRGASGRDVFAVSGQALDSLDGRASPGASIRESAA